MKKLAVLLIFIVLFILLSVDVSAQKINRLIVEIHTQDKRFAGTDDPIHLIIGGRDFELDNPNKDDFERNNTDHFEIDLDDEGFTLELVRAIGIISIIKTEDSYFGGGWALGGLTIWAESQSREPIFQNSSINVWLDGDDLQWSTTLGEMGWNIPEPEPFPPCVTVDIDLGVIHDSDCDGISDESDPRFDTPTDSDSDGLPDLYETISGLDPANPDQDSDGWFDGKKNRRSYLVLTKIKCGDEEEDIGADEIFLVAEDVRFPATTNLDGSWPMNDETEISPSIVVDIRVAGVPIAGELALNYKTRMRLREADWTFFEKPTDDTYKIFDVMWGETGTYQVEHETDDAHYVLTFRSFTVLFADVDPRLNEDVDGDGLSAMAESLLSRQDVSVQPTRIEGYNGLADPGRKEMFVEIDALGEDQQMSYDTKQMVVSQYYYHDISMRMDDGFLGGGQTLLYREFVTIDDALDIRSNRANFWPERQNLFRYGLFVDNLTGGEGSNGVGQFPPNTTFVVAKQTELGQFSAIVLMHEIGHTQGLCHPDGDGKPPMVSGTCPTPADWQYARCRHYCGVDGDDSTAMGADIGGELVAGIVAGAVIGALIGAYIGFGLGGGWGAVIGGFVGGLIGGFVGGILGLFNSDAYLRFVNFNLHEWKALVFF